MRGVLFANNTQTDLLIDQTPGTVSNSVFTGTTSQAIVITSSSVSLFNNSFHDGSNYNVEGKAIYCKCQNLTVANNSFRNLSASRGGAVFLSSDVAGGGFNTTFLFSNNSFLGNTAQHGGALYINDALQLLLAGNTFTGNQALILNPSSQQTRLLSTLGLGGAIYYAC